MLFPRGAHLTSERMAPWHCHADAELPFLGSYVRNGCISLTHFSATAALPLLVLMGNRKQQAVSARMQHLALCALSCLRCSRCEVCAPKLEAACLGPGAGSCAQRCILAAPQLVLAFNMPARTPGDTFQGEQAAESDLLGVTDDGVLPALGRDVGKCLLL